MFTALPQVKQSTDIHGRLTLWLSSGIQTEGCHGHGNQSKHIMHMVK